MNHPLLTIKTNSDSRASPLSISVSELDSVLCNKCMEKKTVILLCCHCDYTACILIQERILLCLSEWPSFSLSDFCVNMFSRHSAGTMETSLPVMQRSVTTCISFLATPIDCSPCHYTKSNSNYRGNTPFQQICLCTHLLFNSGL